MLTTVAPGQPTRSGERYWHDHSQGLTAAVPREARLVDPQFIDDSDALMQMVGPRGRGDYRITVAVKNNPKGAPIENVMETAKSEVAISAIDFTIERESVEQINGRTVGLIYYRHLKRHRSVQADVIGNAAPVPWMMGQAFIARSGDSLITVTLDVDEDQFERGRRVFEQLLDTMTIEDPQKLNERRRERIQRGIDWRSRVTYQRLVDACVDEQLFRITRDGKDIGYMRIRQREDEQMQFPGIRIDVRARVYKGNSTIDTQSNFFLSEELSTEFWSIRITERSLNAADQQMRPGSGTSTYVETGLRSHDRIEVTVEDSFGKKSYAWQMPVAGYISQVEMMLLGQLAVNAEAQDMGFYAYFSSGNSLSFRTERIERNDDGSYRVLTRPNPGRPQYITDYDAEGNFVKQQLPNGSVMIPATRSELAARWHHGLSDDWSGGNSK